MKRLLVSAAILLTPVTSASAHYTDTCKKSPCKRHVIKPFRLMLTPIASCESRGRLTAHDPSGQYHGTFQFDLPSWRGAGGHGDPHQFGYVDQAYRAVVWLHRNGRSSWPNC